MEYVEVARAESGRGEVVLRRRHDPEDPTAAPVLELRSLSTHFRTRAGVVKAVDDISFSAPDKGGTVAVNADGTVSYTPKLKFRGKETFRYTVRDRAGALSNVAIVTVTVN